MDSSNSSQQSTPTSRRARLQSSQTPPQSDNTFRLDSTPINFTPATFNYQSPPNLSYSPYHPLQFQMNPFYQQPMPPMFQQPPPPPPQQLAVEQDAYNIFRLRDEPIDTPLDNVVDESPPEVDAQPTQKTTKKKGSKKVGTSSTKAAATTWTPDQEKALASAWISTSEDPRRGNNQPNESFWRRILAFFNKEVGGSDRTTHGLNSKWGDLRNKCGLFCAIHNNLMSNRRSGQGDEDVLKEALQEYHACKGAPFSHLHVWNVIRDHPKWKEIPLPNVGAGASKRAKTNSTSSSSARGGFIDLNDDFDDTFEEMERPVGTRKAKRNTPSSSSSFAPSESPGGSFDVGLQRITETLENFNKKEDERVKLKQLKAEQRERLIAQQQANFELRQRQLELALEEKRERDELYYYSSHEHLTGRELAYALRQKQKIKEKYNLED